MDEQVAEASFGDAEGGWGDSAGSAEFRAEGDDALALRAAAGGGVSARAGRGHVGVRGGEGFQGGDQLLLPHGVGAGFDERGRDVHQG